MVMPKYYQTNNAAEICGDQMDECPNHQDLYLLRDAAADERGAIADYLECAVNNPCVAEVFLDVAEDEMQHFVETMRLISMFDSVQMKVLEEEDLDFLTAKRMLNQTKWMTKSQFQDDEDVKVIPPHKRDIAAIRCLTKAIQDELHAINKYQKYMNKAAEPMVKEHFCELMNEEKEHVAEFTSALFELTHEPLPEEED